MASLRKFPRSPFWYACFSLPDGRRIQRSTKEKKRKDAQDKADTWEQLSKERAKARQSHKVIAEVYRAAHKTDLPDATAASFMRGWLARRKGELAPATYTAYKGRTEHFLAWLGDKAELALGEVETRHIALYRDAVALKASPATANHAVKILRCIFEDARRDAFIAENPAKDCGLLKKEATASRRPFTIDELKTVLAVADDEWRSMIVCALYTGQRLADIARLSWANIDLLAQEVHMRTGKTGRNVRIPMCKPLLEHIEALPTSDDPKAPLHPRAAAMVSANLTTLSRQFGDLLASAGVIPPRNHNAAKEGRAARRAVSELSFHSIRHTATSMMKNAGISPAIVQDIIGHDSAEMNAHYTHIEGDAKRKALDAMPDITSTPQPPARRKTG